MPGVRNLPLGPALKLVASLDRLHCSPSSIVQQPCNGGRSAFAYRRRMGLKSRDDRPGTAVRYIKKPLASESLCLPVFSRKHRTDTPALVSVTLQWLLVVLRYRAVFNLVSTLIFLLRVAVRGSLSWMFLSALRCACTVPIGRERQTEGELIGDRSPD